MTVSRIIKTEETTINYGDVKVTVNAPSIDSETIFQDVAINKLISLIKKTGILIVDDIMLTRWETAGILAALQLMRRDQHWCYICDTNRNGLHQYHDWNVMIHSRRLPRK